MLPVFRNHQTILIPIEVNDGGLGASCDLHCMGSQLGDGLLLPGECGIADPLQLRSAFAHGVDVTLDFVQMEGMGSPAVLRISRKGPQSLSMKGEARGFVLDLCKECRRPP